MKSRLIIILLNLLSIVSLGQNLLIHEFDLSQGDWELYILTGEGSEIELNNLKNHYTNDKENILSIFSVLTDSVSDTISTGYTHYTHEVVLIKNGSVVQNIHLLNTLGIVNFNDVYYDFNFDCFFQITKDLKKIDHLNIILKDRDNAIKLRKLLKKERGMLLREYGDSSWVHFESMALISTELDASLDNRSRLKMLQTGLGEVLEVDSAQYELRPKVVGYPSGDGAMRIDKFLFYSSNKIVKDIEKLPMVYEVEVIGEYNFEVYVLNKNNLQALIDAL